MNRSQKTEGLFQPQTLDVDETIMDKSLRIVDDLPVAPKIHNAPILPSDRTLPVVQVTPNPGLCVKTKNLDGVKVFINLCKILEIPPPPPLSEEKLQDIIANEDYGTDFRVPMSLGSPRNEKDKSGGACLACDVAINSVWFDDVMFDSITFTTFVVNVAMEGLCEKYGDQVNLDRQNWTILKNKKYLGTLQKHHIQQRANCPGENSKISEMDAPLTAQKTVKLTQPEFVLIKDPLDAEDPDYLVATIELPDQVSKDGLQLDVGEDRLVFSSRKNHLDIFLPFKVDQDETGAQFNPDLHHLTVTMPLVH